MTQETGRSRRDTIMLWAGWLLSALPALLLLFSSVMKLTKAAPVLEGLAKFGYDESVVFGIGVVEVICTILYIVPQTAVLGAILLTGYLGGATATHLRVGDAYFLPIALGVILWGGLVLREPRLRRLMPLRRI